jgi:putative Mg2+ transporter-C (MgtC) family protein
MVTVGLRDFAGGIFLALALGAAIGCEREFRRHEAGIKTNALTATGAAMFMMLSRITGDGERIAAQIVTGIGFLGAGSIMRDGMRVRGLTTAATLWCAAAVGMLAGIGRFTEATMAAGAVVGTNLVLLPLEKWYERHRAAETADHKSSEENN